MILTGGFRANPLTAQLPAQRDALGRVSVDAYLRVRDIEHVYAAGDVARAAADNAGHWAKLMKQVINTRLIYPPRPGHDSRPVSAIRPAA